MGIQLTTRHMFNDCHRQAAHCHRQAATDLCGREIIRQEPLQSIRVHQRAQRVPCCCGCQRHTALRPGQQPLPLPGNITGASPCSLCWAWSLEMHNGPRFTAVGCHIAARLPTDAPSLSTCRIDSAQPWTRLPLVQDARWALLLTSHKLRARTPRPACRSMSPGGGQPGCLGSIAARHCHPAAHPARTTCCALMQCLADAPFGSAFQHLMFPPHVCTHTWLKNEYSSDKPVC
jgi:hypothetical protein